MSFSIDRETLADLGLFTEGSKNIFRICDRTRTKGASVKLALMMQTPFNDAQDISKRTSLISFFHNHGLTFEISNHQMEFIDHYLNFNKKSLNNNPIDAIYDHLNYFFSPTQDYYRIKSGIREIFNALIFLDSFIKIIEALDAPEVLVNKIDCVKEILNNDEIKRILERKNNNSNHVNKNASSNTNSKQQEINCFDINRVDNLFRGKLANEMLAVVKLLYEIDVYSALASLISDLGWCLPQLILGENKSVVIKGLFHPIIKNPVNNDFNLDAKTRLIFVTGPNMAGKSSFLKAYGIAIYLTHLGFPVPAHQMQCSVYNGLYTTINLPDNINEGLSHFYAEIERLKKIGKHLLEKGQMMVIFDELFRGTNLKDALEATVKLCNLVSEIETSSFMISSHFTEVIESLKKEKVSFQYLEVLYDDEVPVFSYKLRAGVSSERLGMYILNRENIFNIFNAAAQPK